CPKDSCLTYAVDRPRSRFGQRPRSPANGEPLGPGAGAQAEGPRFTPSALSRSCKAATSTARGATFAPSARSAAVPAACPMTKHGPDTRADDWPSCDIDAQRPATKRLSTFFG